MTLVHSIMFFLFLCLLGVAAFVVLKPLVIQIGTEQALASPNYASLVSSELITLSRAAPQNIAINYKFSTDKKATYSVDVKDREVTVCSLVKKCYCIDKTTKPNPQVEIQVSASEDCKEVCAKLHMDYDTSKPSSLCAESPILFDVIFSRNSLIGLSIEKTGSSLLIGPLLGD